MKHFTFHRIIPVICCTMCFCFFFASNAFAITYANVATFNTISTNEQVFHGTMASAKATGTGNGYLGGKIRLTLTNTGVPANGSVIIRVYERSTWIPNSIIGATQKKTLTIGDPSYVFEVSPWPSASKYYRKCTSSTFNVTKD